MAESEAIADFIAWPFMRGMMTPISPSAMKHLDLSDEEAAALTKELTGRGWTGFT
jgi:hypothetical protein